jgi:hypothetical protein
MAGSIIPPCPRKPVRGHSGAFNDVVRIVAPEGMFRALCVYFMM